MEAFGISFGERLGLVREDNNLTKSAMARMMGVSPSTWASYENETSFPSPQTIKKFCETFNVNVEWLFSSEGKVYRS